jgi:hypothetical protein
MRAAVLTVLVGAALAVPAAPVAAAACTSGGGVTVVVDFASLGGGTQTRCATGDPSSGLAALRGAGFTPTRAAQEPGYFLCRIDGKPADDPCQRTSPADAYWSYWHAKPGGSWTYSSTGPADHDPAPGTVEGWAFGAGKPPSSAPPKAAADPSPAAASPTPRTARSSPPTPVPVRPSSSAIAAAAVTAPRAAVSTSAAPTRSAAPTATTVVSPSPASSPSPAPGTVTSRPNKYAGPVTAGVLVLLIIAAGIRRLRLRRRAEG